MEALLREIDAVAGVGGSLVAGADGSILASTLPETFDASGLRDLARIFNRTFEGLRVSRRRRLNDLDLTFEKGHLVVKNLGEGSLVILCSPSVNVPLLNLTANVVSRRLQEILKEPVPAPPAAAPALPAAAEEAQSAAGAFPGGDLKAAALALVAAGREQKVVLRVMGEMAIHMRCPSAGRLLPAPTVESTVLEMGSHGREGPRIKALMASLGCDEERGFNALFGTQRLRFVDASSKTCLEIHLGNLISYHRLEFASRLHLDEFTLPLADLLLSQLQNVQPDEMVLRGICAVFVDHELGGPGQPEAIDTTRITTTCAEDWGWCKTTTINLLRAQETAAKLLQAPDLDVCGRRILRLVQMIEDAPKSRQWQARARTGERRRWYEIPE